MATAAKRRKRTIVDDSDDDDDHDPNKNTLKRFLFSSPESSRPQTNKASESRAPAESPSPVQRKTTRAAAAKSQSLTQRLASATTQPRLPTRTTKAPAKSSSTSPEKPRTTTRASKKVKVEKKGKTADLVTLFSRQTQRSQTSAAPEQQSSSSSKGLGSLVLDDIISDPLSEDDDVALHKTAASSIVGKAAQKRFKGSSQLGTANPAAGQRFLKPPKLTSTPEAAAGAAEAAAANDDSRPWSERFGPVNLDELAVHKRKVADVRRWLEDVMGGRMRQRLLVLKGAAGSGKTTTVQLLAKDMRCEVLEWRNPASSFGTTFGQLDLESDSPPPIPPPTNGSKPENSKRLILIEEFPNTFMRSSSGLTSFRNTILQFLTANTPSLSSYYGQDSSSDPITPIVMIISETLLTTTSASADSFTAHRLLGPEILRHPGTGVIEFNAIAPSLLAKALELVVQKEARKSGRRRTPGPLVLKRLGEIGDIRNAIASLEFLCVKGDADADWGSKVAFTRPKRGSKDAPALTKGEKDSLELVSQRESTLGIFHAVGKVAYNKRGEKFPAGSTEAAAETFPDYMAQLSRPRPSEVSVDTLIDETGTDTHTFISALHENYALSCEQNNPLDENSSLDYINGCIDHLSDSDLLCPSWDIFFSDKGPPGGGGGYAGKDSGSHVLRQDEMAFQVAVRGLLFSLPSPVKRQTHPTGRGGDSFKMFYPAYLKLWRAKEELEGLVDMWATKMLKGEDGGPGPPPPSQGSSLTFTNGSSAFRKNTSLGGSSSSSSTSSSTVASSQKRQSTTRPEAPAPVPLLSLGSSARQEMLLERLPYMAHMARGRKHCTFGSMKTRDFDRIVSFQGIGPLKTEDDDDDDDEAADGNGVPAGEAWATDKPTEEYASLRKKRGGGLGAILSRTTATTARNGRAGELGGGGGGGDYYSEMATASLPLQSLVISDDDIEDDF
ncbi:Rad17 cell cycle checkpoint protein-domain-containing protein [Bombardia bombarda]|uniref:Rad17 cell cycle checkpoint protein-domain-containing protein n=1 Tax=Bombardia bombarda TaxID=252184 RepID=A0AA39U7W6_9PEZI|nr:Rad17 cell cycle checkpoint protein-domain-containing protein [Bombardia bombarda]